MHDVILQDFACLVPVLGAGQLLSLTVKHMLHNAGPTTNLAFAILEATFLSLQGLFVSLIFCFLNREVVRAARRHWDRWRHHPAFCSRPSLHQSRPTNRFRRVQSKQGIESDMDVSEEKEVTLDTVAVASMLNIGETEYFKELNYLEELDYFTELEDMEEMQDIQFMENMECMESIEDINKIKCMKKAANLDAKDMDEMETVWARSRCHGHRHHRLGHHPTGPCHGHRHRLRRAPKSGVCESLPLVRRGARAVRRLEQGAAGAGVGSQRGPGRATTATIAVLEAFNLDAKDMDEEEAVSPTTTAFMEARCPQTPPPSVIYRVNKLPELRRPGMLDTQGRMWSQETNDTVV